MARGRAGAGRLKCKCNARQALVMALVLGQAIHLEVPSRTKPLSGANTGLGGWSTRWVVYTAPVRPSHDAPSSWLRPRSRSAPSLPRRKAFGCHAPSRARPTTCSRKDS